MNVATFSASVSEYLLFEQPPLAQWVVCYGFHTFMRDQVCQCVLTLEILRTFIMPSLTQPGWNMCDHFTDHQQLYLRMVCAFREVMQLFSSFVCTFMSRTVDTTAVVLHSHSLMTVTDCSE